MPPTRDSRYAFIASNTVVIQCDDDCEGQRAAPIAFFHYLRAAGKPPYRRVCTARCAVLSVPLDMIVRSHGASVPVCVAYTCFTLAV